MTSKQTFIYKLVKALSDPEYHFCIHWTPSGDSFIIEHIHVFRERVLSAQFNGIKYESFVRQLHLYGFRKVHSRKGQKYRHQQFTKGNYQSIAHVRRKKAEKSSSGEQLCREMKQLSNQQEDLQTVCHQLLNRNEQILQENNQVLRELLVHNQQTLYKIKQIFQACVETNNHQWRDILNLMKESGKVWCFEEMPTNTEDLQKTIANDQNKVDVNASEDEFSVGDFLNLEC